MLDRLESLDQRLLLYLNGQHIDWLDPIMRQVSDKLFWLPLYFFLLYLIQRRYGWRNFGWFVLLVALTILLCDQISSTLLKEYFGRYRPCNNLEIGHLVHRVGDYCGSGYSFVSGHATNYFGLSTLLSMFLKRRRGTALLMLWAALIAYSRVYLGVHYPADILCGALLGMSIGWAIYSLNAYVLRMTAGRYGLDETKKR